MNSDSRGQRGYDAQDITDRKPVSIVQIAANASPIYQAKPGQHSMYGNTV
jgi:hypothetical protein